MKRKPTNQRISIKGCKRQWQCKVCCWYHKLLYMPKDNNDWFFLAAELHNIKYHRNNSKANHHCFAPRSAKISGSLIIVYRTWSAESLTWSGQGWPDGSRLDQANPVFPQGTCWLRGQWNRAKQLVLKIFHVNAFIFRLNGSQTSSAQTLRLLIKTQTTQPLSYTTFLLRIMEIYRALVKTQHGESDHL